MRKSVLALSGLILVMVAACSQNPFTGKQDFNIVSNDQIFPTAFQQYDQFLKENKVIEKLRMYVSGQNILTLSGYKSYDPDFMSDGLFGRGYDLGSFPNPRTVIFGVEVNF